MKKIEPKEYYDVVVIGGGISGLTSAALFRRAGLSCCVIEMNNFPGGLLQGFRRHNFLFDSAIHWLNGCGPHGLVTRIFRIIGEDYPRSKEQKRIRRFISDDFDYLITHNPDEIKDKWIQEFPHERKGIHRFFRDARRIARSFDRYPKLVQSSDTMSWYEAAIHSLKMLRFALPFIPHVLFAGDKGTKKGLHKYFKDPRLLQVFCSEPDLLSCLIPIAWAYSNDFQRPPTGGSQVYAQWLEHVINSLEGDVFYKSMVQQVLVENNVVTGVQVDHRGTVHKIRSKYVVAACDAESLYERMLPKSAIPQKIKDNLKNADLYASAFTVALGLDCPAEELGMDEEIIFLANPCVGRDELGDGNPHTSGIHVIAPTVRDKSLALPEHGTLTLFIPAWMDSNNTWFCERDENGNYIRGEEYKKLKQKHADIIIDRVQDKVIPNLREHILYCDIATPITHHRYTGNKNGSMMGQKPGRKNMKAKVAGYKTPVKNLLLSGHWSEFGGGIPIAVKASFNTALIILKKENRPVFNLYANYMKGKLGIEELNESDLIASYDNSWIPKPTPAQRAVLKRVVLAEE